MEITLASFGTGLPKGELYEALDMAFNYHEDPAQGIIRLVLAEGVVNLTEKQKWVFVNIVLPTLTEGCGNQTCKNKVLVGYNYCPNCALEYK